MLLRARLLYSGELVGTNTVAEVNLELMLHEKFELSLQVVSIEYAWMFEFAVHTGKSSSGGGRPIGKLHAAL